MSVIPRSLPLMVLNYCCAGSSFGRNLPPIVLKQYQLDRVPPKSHLRSSYKLPGACRNEIKGHTSSINHVKTILTSPLKKGSNCSLSAYFHGRSGRHIFITWAALSYIKKPYMHCGMISGNFWGQKNWELLL
ncbi:hypothetical protein CEXT_535671 [Caerostris extrusa]|uniref:Uncharacterized protein n=1 Tax=Caerostris extrusa TaxID=172846 RepID=A0AAV4XDY4_CAEEX|nr:hypothetical protein CEXT_535671 [Caerostris extrusa]